MSKFPTKKEKTVKKSRKKELPPDIFGEMMKACCYEQGIILEIVDCTPDKEKYSE